MSKRWPSGRLSRSYRIPSSDFLMAWSLILGLWPKSCRYSRAKASFSEMLRWSEVRPAMWRRGSNREMIPSLRGQAQIGWRVSARREQQGHKPAVGRLGNPKLVEALRLEMAKKEQSSQDCSCFKPKVRPSGALQREAVVQVLEKLLGTRMAQESQLTMTSTTAERALAPVKEQRLQTVKAT
jgi:hypothetical protein